MELRHRILTAIIFIMSFCSPCAAVEVSGAFSAGMHHVKGETSYEITFPSGMSRLEWPVDLYMGSVSGSLRFDDFLEVSISYSGAPCQRTDDSMTDSDWIDENSYNRVNKTSRAANPGVDIYSESDVDARGLVIDTGAVIYPLRSNMLNIGIAGGYRLEQYRFEAYDTIQTGSPSWREKTGFIGGEVITYSVENDSFYLGIDLEWILTDSTTLEVRGVELLDIDLDNTDNHLRRLKISEGNGNGRGRVFSARLSRKFYGKHAVVLSYSRCSIETDGSQSQYWYGNDPASSIEDDTGYSVHGIPLAIDQETVSLGAGIVFRF